MSKTKDEPGTDLAVKTNGAIEMSAADAELAAFLGENAKDGLALVPASDMVFPKLLVLQPMSPLVTQEDQKAGTLANSISKENYGSRFEFYLIHVYPTRARWLSPDPGADIDCTSQDYLRGSVKDADHANGICSQCPFSQWNGKTAPSCTEFRNLVLIPADGEPTPILLSGSRSALKPIAQFTSAIAATRKPAYFSRWRVETVKNNKDGKVWYTPVFTKVEDIVNPLQRTAKESLAILRNLKEGSDAVKAAQDRIAFTPDREEPGVTTYDGEGGF